MVEKYGYNGILTVEWRVNCLLCLCCQFEAVFGQLWLASHVANMRMVL